MGINMRKVRNNQMIECMRFLACVFVLFVHCPFQSSFGSYVTAIGRSAVPFFLLLSGYFSFTHDPISKAKKALIKMIRITLIAGVICLIWNSANSYIQYHVFSIWFDQYLNIQTVRNFLLFNRATFFNSVFYYFFMMVYVYSIYILSCKLNAVKWFYILSPILLLMLFIVATIGQWYWGGNWLFLGIPFFYLGHFIHSHLYIPGKLKGKEELLILIGTILTLIEKALKIHTSFIYVGSIIIAVSLLCLCINRENARCPTVISHLGTNCSLYIMIIHCEVRDTLQLFISNQTALFPLFVLAISIILALCFNVIVGVIRKRY